jgi:hypothetical protein
MMSMFAAIGILAGILSILMYIPYIKDTVKGVTHPHRASWLIWSCLGLIAFFSQLAKGATDSLWMTAAQTLGTAVVFLLSLKLGVGGFSRRDKISLLTAALGLIVWFFTNEAAFALFITIAVDAIGAGLTAIKAYEMPESETLITWILSAISGILGTIAVGHINPILMAYPFYVFLANCWVITSIFLGKKRKVSIA